MSHSRVARITFVVAAVTTSLLLVRCPRPPDGEDETIVLPGGVLLEMVWIPAGTFLMGRPPGGYGTEYEDPQHEVTFSSGFWMGECELTKRQWTAVMGNAPWSGEEHVLDDAHSAAVCVSWNDAQAFVAQLSAYTGLTFHLPSEAEWEYACRAGTTTRFYWGEDASYRDVDDYAWFRDNAWDGDEDYAHIVGTKLPNAWGLYDMSGNAWEWCEDDWHGDYTGAPTDGAAWVDWPRHSSRARRGGGFDTSASGCRSAWRDSTGSLALGYTTGFRVAR
jgi:formylglycine-generating enzyme required for sulfatase activity